MGLYYVDPAAPGSNNGTDWENAWTDFDSALNPANVDVTNHSIVYMRGVQNITVSRKIKVLNPARNKTIEYRATDSLGVNPGFFTLHGGNTATYCLELSADAGIRTNIVFDGLVCTLAAQTGCYITGKSYQGGTFRRCKFNNNGVHGLQSLSGYIVNSHYENCEANYNIQSGFVTPIYVSAPTTLGIGYLKNCVAIGNGVDGLTGQYAIATPIIDSIFSMNTRYGIYLTTAAQMVLQGCILYKNGNSNLALTGISNAMIYGCKLTNSVAGYGVEGSNLQLYSRDSIFSANALGARNVLQYRDMLGNSDTELHGMQNPDNLDFDNKANAYKRRFFTSAFVGLPDTSIYASNGIPGADKTYPLLYSATPNVGSVDGGTSVVLSLPNGGATGTTGADKVLFGTTQATSYVVDSDTQITAVSPALTAGKHIITATTPAGVATYDGFTAQAGASAPGAFTLTYVHYTPDGVRLKWTPSPGFTTYGVYRDGVAIAEDIDDVDFYVDSDLPIDSYTYKVVAVNTTGSTDSNEVNVDVADGYRESNLWADFVDAVAAYLPLQTYVLIFNSSESTVDNTPAMVFYPSAGNYRVSPPYLTITIIPRVEGSDDWVTDTIMEAMGTLRDFVSVLSTLAPSITVVSSKAYKMYSEDEGVYEAKFELTLSPV